MKKKSPPYAIIGAVILGLIGVGLLVKHERDQAADKAAAIAAEQAKEQALADAAKNAAPAVVAETNTNMRPVLYATQPVDAGVRISATFFEKKQTPQDILPDAYTDKDDIVGWFATRKIEKGDPLTPRNVGKSLPYMSQRISPGMRAISLKVFNVGDSTAEHNDTGGFIVDGDHVDLFYSRTSNEAVYDTRLVLQNVPVLFAPGPTIKTDKTDGINPIPQPGDTVAVTFEVTPEVAQSLIYLIKAGKSGFFSMVLKARSDDTQIKIKPFAGLDYYDNLTRVQKLADKSEIRVKQLATEIEAKAKAMQGTTNETTTPTPPTP